MAGKGIPQSLKAVMECGSCLDSFNATGREARSLPCGHSICKRCVHQSMPVTNGAPRGPIMQRKCPFCRATFWDITGEAPPNYLANALMNGIRTEYGPPQPAARKFLCKECGRGFPRRSELERHKISHSDEFPFVCDICDKMFKTSLALMQHNRVHVPKLPFKCSVCKKAFRNGSNRKKHMKIHQASDVDCLVCGNKFRSNRKHKCPAARRVESDSDEEEPPPTQANPVDEFAEVNQEAIDNLLAQDAAENAGMAPAAAAAPEIVFLGMYNGNNNP